MCGILGFVTKTPAKYESLRSDYVHQGLYVNALRGQHSTGLFYVEDKKAVWAKDNVDARLFLQQRHFYDIVDNLRKDVILCVGHNRHATLGTRGVENAHPIGAGPVCLVHNGTLRAYHSMPKHPTGDSDSARVAQFMSESDPGFLAELPAIEGDYAFVWHDSRTNCVYFATNGRRPLAYLRLEDHILFASEGMMAKWLLARLSTADSRLPRIQKFRPFSLYSLKLGQLDWTVAKYEEKPKVWAAINRTPSEQNNGAASIHESYYDHYDEYGSVIPHDRMGAGAANVVRTAVKSLLKPRELAPQVSRFPEETKKHAKTRTWRSNKLLKESKLELRVGDMLDVNKESMKFYDELSRAEREIGKRNHSLGMVEGFVSHSLSEGDEDVLLTVVHQVSMAEVWYGQVDTVLAELASAFMDGNGDIVLTAIYKEVGAFHVDISEGLKSATPLWPKFISEYFADCRYYYNSKDEPQVPWLETTCVLTVRETDMLLAGKKCQSCGDSIRNIHWVNTIFVANDEFICTKCNQRDDKCSDSHESRKARLEAVDKVNGTKATILTLPNSGLALHPTVRVDHKGDIVSTTTGDIVLPKSKAGTTEEGTT